MSKFKHYNQNQIQLLPPNLNDLIKPDHIARLINQVIDEMDLSYIEDTYSFNGQHAYHPKMLFKVLVYGYTIGLRSSRKLADRLIEDIVFMWLSGRQTPDFRTIADFRKNKLGSIKKAFIEVLSLCRELGMIRVGKVCIDGTKMKASANGNKMQYRKTLNKRKDKIEQQVNDILAEVEQIDREEEKLYGNNTEHRTGIDISEVQKKLNQIKKRKQTLEKNRTKLGAKKSDINFKLRKMRKDRNSYSSTDKDATMMLMKENYIAPGYNVQFASEHQVILAYGVYPNRNDQNLLKPIVEQVKANTNKLPEVIPADAGYGIKMNYRYLKSQQIAAFIPYNNFNKERWKEIKASMSKPRIKNWLNTNSGRRSGYCRPREKS